MSASSDQEPYLEGGLLRTLRVLGRRYPGRGTLIIALIFLSGLAEGIGVIALLPLIGVAIGSDVEVPVLGEWLVQAVGAVGLDESVGALLTVIVLGIAAKAALRYEAMRQAGFATAAIGRDVRLRLIDGLLDAKWRYFTTQPIGSLANAVSGEAERASGLFVRAADLLARVIQVSVYLTVAFVVAWPIALVTIVLGAGMAASLNFLLKITREAAKDQTRLMSSLTSRLSDGIQALKPLKAMGREENLRPFLAHDVGDLEHAQRRQVASQAALDAAYEPIITLLVAILIYIQLVVLGFPFSGVLFVAFLFYRTATYLGTVQKGFQALSRIESAYWALEAAIQNTVRQAEKLDEGHIIDLRNAITFEAVSFSYPSTPVLQAASFELAANRMTALIGPSGSGKTTIADLITGLYTPTSGRITVDGIPLSEADIQGWRRRIGYVPQELTLFHDTIAANVTMSDATLTESDVWDALSLAGAASFVRDMPEALDTVVGEHGMRLSGGQRQRLSIARALVRRPALLILDEATTALDPATEREILRTLESLKSNTTMIAISHQRGLVDAADIVIRLDPGPQGASIWVEAPEHH